MHTYLARITSVISRVADIYPRSFSSTKVYMYLSVELEPVTCFAGQGIVETDIPYFFRNKYSVLLLKQVVRARRYEILFAAKRR